MGRAWACGDPAILRPGGHPGGGRSSQPAPAVVGAHPVGDAFRPYATSIPKLRPNGIP